MYLIRNYVHFLTNPNRFYKNVPLQTYFRRYLSIIASKQNAVFHGRKDHFKGVIVDTSKENCNIETLQLKLRDSLNEWQRSNTRAVWFKVHTDQSDWVPILVKNGFDFHHAHKGAVMLYKWLPKSKSRIPSYAHTTLATGSVVVKNDAEVLAVQEKSFRTGHWKFPGGIVEPGENLVDAAIREVKEETNIDTKFRTLLSVTHAHKGQFGCSDFYVVFEMTAVSYDIKMCEFEIEKCEWFDIDEFLQRSDITPFNKALLSKCLDYRRNRIEIGYETGVHTLTQRPYAFYSVNCKQN